MIEFLSSWAKGLGVTIVIVSIFEMILPNNKSKKYIRMVLGIYVIFSVISPLIESKEVFNMENLNLEQYQYESVETSNVDQTSMDERIKELYEEELEKDIKDKLEEKGYKTMQCKVTTQISNEEEETKISRIKLKIEKVEKIATEEDNTTEEKIVTQIQKIKKVDTKVEVKENKTQKEEKNVITKSDIQNIKKFLIEEYGVEEKCLEVN